MWKQVKFRCLEDEPNDFVSGIAEYDIIHGHLILIRVICGYSGLDFDANEVEIIKEYDDWSDLSPTIMGS